MYKRKNVLKHVEEPIVYLLCTNYNIYVCSSK